MTMGSKSQLKTFSIVVAMLRDRGIGLNNSLPWPSLKKDYQHYIHLTSTPRTSGNKCVNIKGHLTWESTGLQEKSNPNIINIVISKTLRSCPKYVSEVADSLQAALAIVAAPPYADMVDSVWVMGGQMVYQDAIHSSLCERIYLTRIDAQYPCDSFFPVFEDKFHQVRLPEVDSHDQEDNGISYKFEVYEANH